MNKSSEYSTSIDLCCYSVNLLNITSKMYIYLQPSKHINKIN